MDEATKDSKPQVTIYSTSTCHFCNLAKTFFQDNNIEFTEYNVAEDQEKGREMMERSGQMGVPVIYVGEEIVLGFDQPKLKELLGL